MKDKIWVGTELLDLPEKKSDGSDTGESWVISVVEDDTSVVSNGVLKGMDLKEL